MNDVIHVRLEPTHINYVNRIMEGYEYLGVVTTVNSCEGIIAIRVTPDTVNDVRTILANLPIAFEYL
ncbi:hypothetical protein SDC9_30296 [bioreactor metagenome]|uniref:DUF4911 domain-containing protein n=1 Tax=bioreactor metagenome TaxID=1076179 RepID=A0A644UZG7_9ZZZZ|nr:DUF4911 domain-containing protein [Negativicutes bacterium]